ncbi:MAG: bthL 3 [Firmicutes bacterium]|nr:bthL 3 [Bacillota bacterium]
MARYSMLIDVDKCTSCYNCFLACKDEHCGRDSMPIAKPQPENGHAWIRIIDKERGQYPKIKVSSTPVTCMHCDDAPCIAQAQNGAVYQRNDGIVIIDPEKSKNQHNLVETCPYDAIFWNDAEKIPQKCTMCAHLLDQGWKEPRCVVACPTGALVFGDIDDSTSEIAKLMAQSNLETYRPEIGAKPAVKYIGLPKKFIAGTVCFAGIDECAENVAVEITGKNYHNRMMTNGFGDFEFEGLADDCEYEITIRLNGYVPQSCKVTTEKDVYIGTVYLEKLATDKWI